MSLKIRKQSMLILLLSSASFACFVVGILVYSGWLESSIRKSLQRQIIQDNTQIAQQMTRLVEEMNLGVGKSEDGWSKLQKLVEEIQLPNEGLSALLTESREKLCVILSYKVIPT